MKSHNKIHHDAFYSETIEASSDSSFSWSRTRGTTLAGEVSRLGCASFHLSSLSSPFSLGLLLFAPHWQRCVSSMRRDAYCISVLRDLGQSCTAMWQTEEEGKGSKERARSFSRKGHLLSLFWFGLVWFFLGFGFETIHKEEERKWRTENKSCGGHSLLHRVSSWY